MKVLWKETQDTPASSCQTPCLIRWCYRRVLLCRRRYRQVRMSSSLERSVSVRGECTRTCLRKNSKRRWWNQATSCGFGSPREPTWTPVRIFQSSWIVPTASSQHLDIEISQGVFKTEHVFDFYLHSSWHSSLIRPRRRLNTYAHCRVKKLHQSPSSLTNHLIANLGSNIQIGFKFRRPLASV